MPTPAYAVWSTRHDDLNYHCFEGDNPPDLAELGAMMNVSWGADYADKAWFRFDEAYLRWLIPRDGGHGIVVCDDEGTMLACLVGCMRRVYMGGQERRVAYQTGMTTTPRARGRSTAARLVQLLHDYVSREHDVPIIIATFDGDSGGRGVFKAMLRERPDYCLPVSRPILMWGLLSDMELAERYSPLVGAARVALLPGLRGLFTFKGSRKARALALKRIPTSALPPAGPGLQMATLAGASMQEMYGEAHGDRAGVLQASSPAGNEVCVAYHVLTLSRDGEPDALHAHLQLVWPGQAKPSFVALVLSAVAARMVDQGCIFVSILDSGMVSSLTLMRSGFLPSDRHMTAMAYGPRSVLEEVEWGKNMGFELM